MSVELFTNSSLSFQEKRRFLKKVSWSPVSEADLREANQEFDAFMDDGFEGTHIIGALFTDTIIGFCSLDSNNDFEYPRVSGKYVISKYRRLGIATYLSKNIRTHAQNLGYSGVCGYIPGVWRLESDGSRTVADPEIFRQTMNREGGYDSYRSVLKAGPIEVIRDDIELYEPDNKITYLGVLYKAVATS